MWVGATSVENEIYLENKKHVGGLRPKPPGAEKETFLTTCLVSCLERGPCEWISVLSLSKPEEQSTLGLYRCVLQGRPKPL